MESKIPASWTEMISNQESSGKSAASWCRENRISTSTFYYRRKKVKAATEETTESDSGRNEVVKINFKNEPAVGEYKTKNSEKIRMIKDDVILEFPASLMSEILSAVMRGGGLC